MVFTKRIFFFQNGRRCRLLWKLARTKVAARRYGELARRQVRMNNWPQRYRFGLFRAVRGTRRLPVRTFVPALRQGFGQEIIEICPDLRTSTLLSARPA